MLVKQVMSTTPVTSAPQATLQEIAMLMWNNDCGAVPLVDGEGRPAGMVTDRDIAMGAALQNNDPTNRFEPLCNKAMVEIETIAPATAGDPAEDAQRPRQKSVSVDDNGMGDVLACTGAPGDRPGTQPDGSVDVGQALGFLRQVSSHHRSHKEIASAARW